MGLIKLLKKHESCTIKGIKWICLSLCLTGLGMQSYDCFMTYFSCPQGVEIATRLQTSLGFPSVSFCPYYESYRSGNPQAYNWTKIDQCKVDLETKFNGLTPECQDPKKVWENATPKLEDFGVSHLRIGYFGDTNHPFIENANVLWKRMASVGHGACFSLTLNKEITRNPIYFLSLFIQEKKSFEILIHSKGSLVMDPNMSLDYKSFTLKPEKSYKLYLDYEEKTLLDFDGKECENNETYDYGSCVENDIHERSLNEIGCTTPFGKNLETICTNQEKAKFAMKLYNQGFANSTCQYPCKRLASFTLTVDSVNYTDQRSLMIYFSKYYQTSTSKCTYTALDLYAALGGYIGLFLGISIFEINNLVTFFVRKLLQSQF